MAAVRTSRTVLSSLRTKYGQVQASENTKEAYFGGRITGSARQDGQHGQIRASAEEVTEQVVSSSWQSSIFPKGKYHVYFQSYDQFNAGKITQ